MTTNSALDGQAAAENQHYLWWLIAGTVTGIFGLLWAYLTTPVPTAQVLLQGPTEPAAQQVFISAYVSRAKSLRVRKAWIGVVLFLPFYGTLSFACAASVLLPQLAVLQERRLDGSAQPTSALSNGSREESAEAVAQRQREELIAAADATRADVTTMITEIETIYQDVFSTHEAAADAIPDEWEKRWARDRVTNDQWLRDQSIDSIQRRLANADAFELPLVRARAEQGVRSAQAALATAQEHLAAAQTVPDPTTTPTPRP